jgi:hypothetical protein
VAKFVGSIYYELAGQGWSENYPLLATTSTLAIASVVALGLARKHMLCSDVAILGGKVSDPEVVGDTYLVGSISGTGDYGLGPPILTSLTPNVCLQLKCNAGPLKRSTRPMHGLPTDVIAGPYYAPTGDFTTALDDLITLLTTEVAISTKTGGPPPTYTFTAIDAVVIGPVWTHKVGRPFGLHRGRARVAP